MLISCDTETTGLYHRKGDRPYAIGLGYEDGKTDYKDVVVDKNRQPYWDLTLDWVLDNPIYQVTNPYIDKVFANAKFDIGMLASIGLEVKGKIDDVLLAAKICNNLEPTTKLKALCKKYVGIDDDDEKALQAQTIKARNQAKKLGYKTADNVAADYWLCKALDNTNNLCEIYCRRDCERTIKLWQFYREALTEFNCWNTYNKEIALLLDVIIPLENRGIRLDKEKTSQRIFRLTKNIFKLEKIIKNGDTLLNLDSPKQLGKFLTEKLKLPLVEKTDGGDIATGTPILKKFKDNRTVRFLLRRGGYTTGRQQLLSYEEFCVGDSVHGSLNQMNTRTWRFSFSDPNLQNVSNPETSGGEYVVDCRSVFIPRDGYFWIVADAAQLEHRIFVSRAGEPNLIKAYLDGRDPHNETRLRIPFLAKFPVGIGRKLAKNTNFTVINCGGANVLLERYDIPLEDGKPLIKEFYEHHPLAKKRQQDMASFAKQNGYIFNPYNRKLFINPEKYYQATSYDIQSGACDFLKYVMYNLARFFKKEKLDCHILLQIHDELIIECHKSYLGDPNLYRDIQAILNNNGGVFCIPTPFEMKETTTHWNDKKEICLN